ncbi:MAG: cold shock domain-containing protein [Thermoplasmata archaeon]|nr:MAG: cold shock domain-containing protein [Thermoplasmata archaeon]
MNEEIKKILKPDEGICKDCVEEIKKIECASCKKNLFSYKGKIYECPLCEQLYCEECWQKFEEKKKFKGKIKVWFEKRNYGFIKSGVFKQDIFFHKSDANFVPEEGQTVEFDVEETKKGYRARNVRGR